MSSDENEQDDDDGIVRRIWKCSCGKIQVLLTGEPFLEINCHCRSCVSTARYLDGKYHQKNTSMILDENGGAAITMFFPNQVEFLSKEELLLLEGKEEEGASSSSEDINNIIGCVKVGPKGVSSRKYVMCCGTFFYYNYSPMGMKLGYWAFNRNGIYKTKTTTTTTNRSSSDDDNSNATTTNTYTATNEKYIPQNSSTIVNTMKKFAFDPSNVPEPFSETAPMSVVWPFLKVMINPFGQSIDQSILDSLMVDPSKADIVPITWDHSATNTKICQYLYNYDK